MSWKDTAINNPGTSIKYGADDVEMLMRMLNGVTTGINTVEIKSNNKWGFWDNILFIRNQADNRSTTIRGQSNVPASNVTLSLPPITSNDTLVALGLKNIFSINQEFDDGVWLKHQSAPANPDSGFEHFYTAGNGHLIRRDNTGAEFDYDVGLNGLASGLTKQIQYNNAGVFAAEAGFEYDQAVNEATIPGLTVTENFILNGVISPPQITTDQNNYNPSGLATATTLRLTTNAPRDITGIAAQPNGTILYIHNIGSFNIVLKDESGSSTTTNRFALSEDAILKPDNSATIKYDGVTGRWRLLGTDSNVFILPANIALHDIENTFTEQQRIIRNSVDILTLQRDSSTINNEAGLNFQGKDSAGNFVNYGRISMRMMDTVNGSEDGKLKLFVRMSDVLTTTLELNELGEISFGANLRGKFSEDGLTAVRKFLFPDIDSRLLSNGNAKRMYYYSDCLDNGEPLNTETVSGTGASAQIIATTELGVFGVYELDTGTTSTGAAALVPESLELFTFGQGETIFEFRVKFPTLSTSGERYSSRLGFIDSETSTSPVDGVYFLYDESTSPNWQIVTRNNSTGNPSVSNLAVGTGWVKLKIVINEAGTSAAFFVNDTELNVSPLTTNIPKTSTRMTAPAFIIFKTVGSTQRDLHIDYYMLDMLLTTSR